LGHAGPYNGDIDPPTQKFGIYDTLQWSLMSYINPSASDAVWNGFTPTTPMIADIAAIQRTYGAPTTAPLASGGQTFGFNSNVTGAIHDYFDFTKNT
jgi:serralysin